MVKQQPWIDPNTLAIQLPAITNGFQGFLIKDWCISYTYYTNTFTVNDNINHGTACVDHSTG